MSINDTFANRLKLAMQERDMKAADLCRATGLPRSTISSYLSGTYEAKQDKLTVLAKALNVTESWLMGYNDGAANDNKRTSSLVDAAGGDVDKMVDILLSDISDSSGGTLMLDGKPATPEAIELFRNALRLDIEFAKRKNEEMQKNEKSDTGGK